MKLPKIMIFDVGDTLICGKWEDQLNGYIYLYEEVLDVKESVEDYLDFIKGMLPIIKERDKVSLEFNFRSFFNYLKDLYGLKTNKTFEEIELAFSYKLFIPKLKSNIVELLEYLNNKGVILNVLSNSMFSSSCLNSLLENLGIRKYFKYLISSGDHLVRKPSEHLFNLYIKKYQMLGYKISDICYIGNDFYYDIVTPAKLGMMSILISDKDIKHSDYLEVSSYVKLKNEFDKNE